MSLREDDVPVAPVYTFADAHMASGEQRRRILEAIVRQEKQRRERLQEALARVESQDRCRVAVWRVLSRAAAIHSSDDTDFTARRAHKRSRH